MSYVLEALRRAEAERQRGQVPGLDAQPLPAPEAGLAAAGTPRLRWLWPVLGLLAAASAGLAWWLLQPAATPPAATLPSAASPRPPAVRVPPPAPPLAATPRPPVARAPAPRPAEPPAAATAVPAASAAAGGRIPRLQELPEATRRQIPALAFGGATDSPEPSARMLIVNGQVAREGDEVAPGLQLERIALRSARFRWRGQPFEVAY